MVLALGKEAPLQAASDPNRGQLALQLVEQPLAHVTTDSTADTNDFHSLRSRASSARPRLVSR